VCVCVCVTLSCKSAGVDVGAVDAELVDGHSSLLTQLTSQRVDRQRVHDGHDQQRNVERTHRRRDDERLRLGTTTLHTTNIPT